MELKCPNCGKVIPVENVNIQEMVALCGTCQHIFAFNRATVARKAKRHIPPLPKRVREYLEGDLLELSYRLVFGSNSMFGLAMIMFGAVVSSAILVSASLNHEPASLSLFLGLLALMFWYIAAVGLTTTTTITLDSEALEVRSGPLPFPLKDDKTLSTADIVRISIEEAYQPNAPLPPYYNLCAEMQDGARLSVVSSLPRVHAQYMAATLDDHLHHDVDAGPTDEYDDDFFDHDVQPDTLADTVARHRQHGAD